jgi:hypothetical protein
MELTPLKLLRMLLPSLCIFYCLSNAMAPHHVYHEAFGGEEFLLDVFFENNPRGLLASHTSPHIPFKASLLGQAEERVVGHYRRTNGKETYVFQSSGGIFTGQLEKGPRGCEPALRYRLERGNEVVKSGVLRAGFCH